LIKKLIPGWSSLRHSTHPGDSQDPVWIGGCHFGFERGAKKEGLKSTFVIQEIQIYNLKNTFYDPVNDH